MFDIVGIDYPCVDLNVNVDTLPESNGTLMINSLSWQGGGKVASGIVTAARLAGAVGDDRYGSFCRKDFVDHGVDVGFLKTRKSARTALDIVLSDKETMGRSLIFHPGDVGRLAENELPYEYLKNTKYFYGMAGLVRQKSGGGCQKGRRKGFYRCGFLFGRAGALYSAD